MVPNFRLVQERIDEVNRVLREQITGIRVVRAFVREPLETDRFAHTNDELTDVSVRAGRWLAAMFPVVMLVVNVSSVAVLWFGGHRVDSGDMQIGALTAFISYLMQILMSVMMGTFMLMMVPRSSVCADRIAEVLDTDHRRPAGRAGLRADLHGHLDLDGVGFTYPGADQPVLRDVSFTARPGQTVAIIGSTGAGKTTLVNLIPRLFDATAGTVRVDGVDVRDRAGAALVAVRAGAAEGVPVHRDRRRQPAARQAGRHRGGDVGALEIAQARDFVEAMPERLEARIAQGGTNVSRRPAAAARHRPGADPPAGDLPLRRLVLRARPGHRRPAARRAEAGHP